MSLLSHRLTLVIGLTLAAVFVGVGLECCSVPIPTGPSDVRRWAMWWVGSGSG